jgi:hypothetical protein
MGDMGTPGTHGTDGEPGVDAPIPLTARVVDAILDNIKAGDDEDEATEHTIDLIADGYFSGGMEPYKFTPGTSTGFATAKIDDDNHLVLKLDVPEGGYTQDAQFMNGFSVMVTATDKGKESATATVTVKPNRAPQFTGLLTATEGALDDGDLTIGTQDGEADLSNGFYSCKMFDECVLDIFTDQGDVTRSVVSPSTSDKFSRTFNDDDMIQLNGLASTFNPKEEEGSVIGYEPITVKVRAVDGTDLKREVTIQVNVNSAPMPSEGSAAVTKTIEVLKTPPSGTMYTVSDTAASLFTDIEGDSLTISYKSDNVAVATVGPSDGEIDGIAHGTATITVTATEGTTGTALGQSTSIDFTVTVK